MGLLDDAIREHLELKRRRGADPGEVARQEQEALGDPRAQAAPAEAEEGLLPEDAPVPAGGEDEPAAVAVIADEPDEAPEPVLEEPALPEPEEDEPWLEDEPLVEEPRAPEPEPEPEPPTAEQPASAPSDEDVLEETPEFLQETPEHDRLWFEQRPPRDFDFDS
jgi:hypothetical protein